MSGKQTELKYPKRRRLAVFGVVTGWQLYVVFHSRPPGVLMKRSRLVINGATLVTLHYAPWHLVTY